MTRAFVLIDAVPKHEEDVLEALGKFPGVVGRRRLQQRVGQGDIIALLDASDGVELEKLITSRLRSVAWVHAIIRVQPHHTLMGPLLRVMEEMHHEADAAKKS